MNYCYTCFSVAYQNNFNLKHFASELNLDEKTLILYDCGTAIEIGANERYEKDVNDMIRKTLGDLINKADKLLELKKLYGLEYKLCRVCLLSRDDENMNLSLSPDIIEFLSLSQTEDALEYTIK